MREILTMDISKRDNKIARVRITYHCLTKQHAGLRGKPNKGTHRFNALLLAIAGVDNGSTSMPCIKSEMITKSKISGQANCASRRTADHP